MARRLYDNGRRARDRARKFSTFRAKTRSMDFIGNEIVELPFSSSLLVLLERKTCSLGVASDISMPMKFSLVHFLLFINY